MRHNNLILNTKWMLMELLRSPSYVVSTIGFPIIFYLIFALPEAKDINSANFIMASFCVFAAFGVFFLQFGVSITHHKSHSWYFYLNQLLPSMGI